MGKTKFVYVMDEETQSLIINSLMLLRNEKLNEGMDVGWIGDVILDICNAPEKKARLVGDAYER